MKSNSKRPVIVALALPLILMLIIILSIYLPEYLESPEGRFIYAVCEDFNKAGIDLTVVNGRLTKPDTLGAAPIIERFRVSFYIYNMETGNRTNIEIDEALDFEIDTSQVSSTGHKIAPGSRLEGIFPFSIIQVDSTVRYLKGKFTAQKLELDFIHGNTEMEFRFIGWIK